MRRSLKKSSDVIVCFLNNLSIEDENYKDKPTVFWKDLLKTCDLNGDGYIDYNEFVYMMKNDFKT